MELRELVKGVYAMLTEVGDPRGDSNFGLIKGENGSVLIDADIRRWDEVNHFMESVTDVPIRYAIITHDNFDHASANNLLAQQGAVIISSEACRTILATSGQEEFATKMQQDPTLSGKFGFNELTLPMLTTDGKMRLDLGNVVLEIAYVGKAHTAGDMVVYLPNEEILFAGDVLFNGCHPVTRNGDTANWIHVLNGLCAKPIQLTVPGHGQPAGGKSNLEELRDYFQIFRARIGELKARGLPVEEVEKTFSLPEYASWGKKNWLPVSIRKIYSELQ